jgi:origin recognition complex subunit 2
LIKQTVSDSFIRLGHSSSLKNSLKILDFGFSTLVKKGPVAKGLTRYLFPPTDEDLFLIIHNIDGPMLRAEKVQTVLSMLADVPNVHLLASVDHINSPLSM